MVSKRISVIVPFHSEQNYLHSAISSVLKRPDILAEVLIINDNPGDESERFLERFESLPKVRVLHNNTNIGLAATRNVGISVATGDYIQFLDSDDFMSADGLASALDYAVVTRADILQFPTFVYQPESGLYYKFFRDEQLFGRRLAHLNTDNHPELRFATSTWSFLIERAFLLDNKVLQDPEQRKFEDHLFVLKLVESAQNAATFDQWIRAWRKRGQSISTQQPTLSDMRLQISLLKKCIGFMANEYDTSSLPFQRELAFSFSRLLWTWQTLRHCITVPTPVSESYDLLTELQMLFSAYSLDRSVFSDPIFEKIAQVDSPIVTGKRLSTDEVHQTYRLMSSGDWSALKSVINNDTNVSSVTTLLPSQAKNGILLVPNFLTRHVPSLNTLTQIGLKDFIRQSNFGSNIDVQLITYDADFVPRIEDVVSSLKALKAKSVGLHLDMLLAEPTTMLWADYQARLNLPDFYEKRTFYEFIEDHYKAVEQLPLIVQSAAIAASVDIELHTKFDVNKEAESNTWSEQHPIDSQLIAIPESAIVALAAIPLANMTHDRDKRRKRALAIQTANAVRMDSVPRQVSSSIQHAAETLRRSLIVAWADIVSPDANAHLHQSGQEVLSKGNYLETWLVVDRLLYAGTKEAAIEAELNRFSNMRFGKTDPFGGRSLLRRVKETVKRLLGR